MKFKNINYAISWMMSTHKNIVQIYLTNPFSNLALNCLTAALLLFSAAYLPINALCSGENTVDFLLSDVVGPGGPS